MLALYVCSYGVLLHARPSPCLGNRTVRSADLCDFVKRFKQSTAFAYRKAHKESLWQPGYHERILRDDEATEAVVRYLLENPIRGGLAKEIGEYPFAGSDVYTMPELLTAWDKKT